MAGASCALSGGAQAPATTATGQLLSHWKRTLGRPESSRSSLVWPEKPRQALADSPQERLPLPLRGTLERRATEARTQEHLPLPLRGILGRRATEARTTSPALGYLLTLLLTALLPTKGEPHQALNSGKPRRSLPWEVVKAMLRATNGLGGGIDARRGSEPRRAPARALGSYSAGADACWLLSRRYAPACGEERLAWTFRQLEDFRASAVLTCIP